MYIAYIVGSMNILYLSRNIHLARQKYIKEENVG